MTKVMDRNEVALESFTKFCKAHPTLRFWQALSVWVNKSVFVTDEPPSLVERVTMQDTFFWEGKDG